MGIIDGSVLTAVGEILIFPTLAYTYKAIELGLEVKFQKGETSIEIHRDEDEWWDDFECHCGGIDCVAGNVGV